jgi:mannose-6-phosphate isomerase-like protein (cupin superfamily)
MLRKIRRVITGHNKDGKSVIVSDEASPNTLTLLDNPACGLTDLWVTHATPADNSSKGDAASRKISLSPPASGSIFRVVEFPPDMQLAQKFDRKAVFAAMGAHDAMDSSADARHPFMHKTNTVDYAIVLAGEIYAMMDIGETKLSAGDCLIQRGTNHSWSNRSDKSCLVAFILIDAQPI